MRKYIKILVMVILCSFFVLGSTVVNAAQLNRQEISFDTVTVNRLEMNLPASITYAGIIAGRDYTPINNGDFIGAAGASAPYWMFNINSQYAYISAEYRNVGFYVTSSERIPISCVMTLSNFMSGGSYITNGNNATIGFNKFGLAWILHNVGSAGIGPNNLRADVEIYFFRTGDPNRTPMDLGEAYIGVGGMNSEKRVFNNGQASDEHIAAVKNQMQPTNPTPGVNGHQWEWVSYDTQPVNGLKAYYLGQGENRCRVSYVTRNETVNARDEDTNPASPSSQKVYANWGVARPMETFNVNMQNPTGYNVISNAGTAYDGMWYRDIREFTNWGMFKENYGTIMKQSYMVEVGKIRSQLEANGLVNENIRTYSKPFSVYKFVAGKDVGSVEMALYPISLSTEVTEPIKTVNKAFAKAGDTLTYEISQRMGNMNDTSKRINQLAAFKALKLTDRLPSGIRFTGGIVKDEFGNVLNDSQCHIDYDAVTNLVTFTFSNDYLNHTMRYTGETYTFTINTVVEGDQYTFINKATTTFNSDYSFDSNEVVTVNPAPTKQVDKAVVGEGENLRYTIQQKVGNMFDTSKVIDLKSKYTALKLTDPLPEQVEYVSAAVKNENGVTLSDSQCHIDYNAATNTVTFIFSNDYLNNTMRFVGETYTFLIDCTVKDLGEGEESKFKNKATTTFNNDFSVDSKEVETKVIYDILTKSINAYISEMITEIPGGDSNKVVTFTPDLGYYIDKVEWQTQSQRYAQTTPELVNVTEIPNINKVRIPETKNGNTYKHETTITGVNPNLPAGNQKTNITEEEKNTLNYDPFAKTDFTFNNVDNNHYIKVVAEPLKMVVQVSKEDAVTGKETQGDAKFIGAQYTVYEDEALTKVADVITLDANGNGSSKELLMKKADANGPYGEYFVKETKAPEGYLLDETVYRIYETAVEQTINREKISYHPITSKEEVWKGRIQLIKFENILGTTEERPATGAILRLTLDSSNGQVYYDVTIDEKGYGEFVGDVLKDYYPYTIPYGQYTITEIKESDLGFHTYFYIQPEKVDLRKKHEQLEYRIFGEEPIEAYLKLQKTDKHNGATVELAGAKYKIWDVQNNKWVSQMIYPSGVYIDEFETNDEGYFITPQKLLAGDYVVYETQAPEGYYLDDEYRIPEKESDLGDATKGGVAVRIDSVAMGLITGDQLVYDPDAELIYEMEIANNPLKVKLEIDKKGEMFSEVLMSDTKYGEKYTPKYTMQGLPGVTYEIYSVNDIKSSDGRNTYVTKGTLVDTITTDENGIAITEELFPGEYEIREVVTPKGYITDTDIENVTLTNTNMYKRVETHKKELTNVRQKLELTFEKEYEEVNYANGETLEKKAVFGVYTNQALKNNKGNIVIPQGKLVDVIEVEGDNANVTSTIDLPEGEYYVQELEASYPYTKSEEKQYFTLKHTNNIDEFVVTGGEKFTNTYEGADVSLIKLSTTTFDNVVINGQDIEVDDMDEQVQELINNFKGMTEEEIEKYLEDNEVKFVPGATYKVYVDEDCTKPLYVKSGDKYVDVEMVTNETGMIRLEDIPLGTYYIKEIKPAKGYELSEEIVKLDLTVDDRDALVYKALIEDSVVGPAIQKTDDVTGDPVFGCVFEITDKDGKVLLHAITNDRGEAHLPNDILKDGETYYFTEVKMPDMYELNETVYEFTAEFDEERQEFKPIKVDVENIRKTIDFVKVIKRDSKTSEPLQGCVFTIVLLDKDGNEYVNKDGEKVYLVENAVTDENGEYVIENVPYGTYKFVEMVAPEGYEIDENMTGLTFVADDDSKEGIIFEVTNTGDIQVVVLSIVAIISVLGIVVISKRRLAK